MQIVLQWSSYFFEQISILFMCLYILDPGVEGRTRLQSHLDMKLRQHYLPKRACSCPCGHLPYPISAHDFLSWRRKFYQMRLLKVKNKMISYFMRKYTFSYLVLTSFDKHFAAGKITVQGYFSYF